MCLLVAGHLQPPYISVCVYELPHSSADKSVKVFSWEGQLLGIILTDFGWYKERYPWIFTYDKGPSDQKLKVEVYQRQPLMSILK